MDTAGAAIISAGVTLLFNIGLQFFGGGWKLSTRLAAMETSMDAMRREVSKLSEVLVAMADFRGDMKVINIRLTTAEQDIRELQHGEGLVVRAPQQPPPNSTPY